MKKFLSKIINILSIVIIIAAVAILASVLLSGRQKQPNIMGYSMFRVLTQSMGPSIPTNSLIITKQTGAEDIELGDVITFRSQDPMLDGATNTHRVIAIDESGASPVFTTKGDNNAVEDKYPVYAEDLVGRVVFVSHILGTMIALLSNPLCFGAVIIVPLAVIFLLNIRDLFKAAKELSEADTGSELPELFVSENRDGDKS